MILLLLESAASQPLAVFTPKQAKRLTPAIAQEWLGETGLDDVPECDHAEHGTVGRRRQLANRTVATVAVAVAVPLPDISSRQPVQPPTYALAAGGTGRRRQHGEL